MAEMKKRVAKKQKENSAGVIAGIIVAVTLVVIFVVCVVVANMTKNSGFIKDMAEFKVAIRDRAAVNCMISHDDEGDFTLQTNEGFSKVKVVLYESDGSKESMLAIKDEGTYYWDDEGNAFKLGDSSEIDGFIEELTEGAEDEEDGLDEGYVLKCDATSKSDFSVPDLDFVDFSDME
ncbi:MAG: hypothetical protein LBT19_02380 [Candidatus Nomurabacteria bacterium]|jgi:hypothetical protein|nr:hypothetical protein [Candidatus Nomurabacteria bacterium]